MKREKSKIVVSKPDCCRGAKRTNRVLSLFPFPFFLDIISMGRGKIDD